jgi:MFS family permease
LRDCGMAPGKAMEGAETPSPLQVGGMRNAIAAQCCGAPAQLIFTNGLMLLYLSALGMAPDMVLLLLSLFSLPAGLLIVPAAYLADRFGIKRVGQPGLAIMTVSFLGLIPAATLSGGWLVLATAVCISAMSLGNAMFTGGWFGLLHPVVPESMRGLFFGRLRVSWQSVALVVTGFTIFFLTQDTPLIVFHVILAMLGLGLFLRIVFYRRIPLLVAPSDPRLGLLRALGIVLRTPSYAPFCAYVFLLTLFTANAPVLFGLIEKKVLGLGDNLVTALGLLFMTGCMLGYALGGQAVHRLGTKPVFVGCHFLFGLALALFLARDFVPIGTVWFLGGLHVAFGIVCAASTIAVSTELLFLVPPGHRSLATGLGSALIRLGTAMAGLLSAAMLRLGMLAPEWSLGGHLLSAYDSILLMSATMVVLMVITLGLIPSVIGKPRWLPGSN